MTKVTIVGALDDESTGYGTHTGEFASALKSISPHTVETINIRDYDRIRARVYANEFTNTDIIISIAQPTNMGLFKKCAAYKICYTVWESTKLPDSWYPGFEIADEIWVPSRWNRDVIAENGVAEDKIFTVPEGVNPGIFRPDGDRIPFVASIPGFKFLHVGKAEPRKSTCELLYAFDAAFDNDQQVVLVIACHNYMIPNFNGIKFLENMSLKNRRKIIYVSPIENRATFANLYRTCDAFIMPSKAESWGLPALEAMASGLPTALVHYAGVTEFATPGNIIELPYKMEHIGQSDLPYFDRSDGDYGEWAAPDIAGMASNMHNMYENMASLKSFSLEASKDIRQRWSWDNAASIANDRISSLIRKRRQA